MGRKQKYHPDDVIGDVTIIEKDPTSKSGKYFCKCGKCGKIFSVIPAQLKNSDTRKQYTKSCGCIKKDLKRKEIVENNIFKFFNGSSISVIQKTLEDNGKSKRNSASGWIGVYEQKRKNGSIYYKARITVQGKQINLGRFDHIEDAVFARKTAEYKYYGKLIADYHHENKAN